MGHRPPDADLAPDQLAAVSHERGGARVIAPAGSGKTRVLTERLRHLIEDRGVEPVHGDRAGLQPEGGGRAEGAIRRPRDTPMGRTSTRSTAWAFGSATSSEGGGGCASWRSQRCGTSSRASSRSGVRRTPTPSLPYIDGLSAVRLGLTSPARVEEEIPDAQGLADGFDSYRGALAEAGAVDFDEQIYRAIEILLRDPDARAAAQSRSRHLLVDEFQDLNAAHMLLIRLLCAPAYNCFGVGDDDQVIYGYSGATPEYLINFEEYFPGAHNYALEVNYRCPPAVVRAATCVLSYNRNRIAKTIRTPPDRLDERSRS